MERLADFLKKSPWVMWINFYEKNESTYPRVEENDGYLGTINLEASTGSGVSHEVKP